MGLASVCSGRLGDVHRSRTRSTTEAGMVTRHQRTGRQARTWICSLLVVASACWLLPVANASAATNFTWSGAAPPGTSNWSNGLNWSGTAPSGTVGTLTFPALTSPSPACTALPWTGTCYTSINDVSSLEVTEKLIIETGVPYNITGEGITLFGGITASSVHVCEFCGASIGVPITLGASQAWSITGGKGQSLGIGSVTGSTDSLTVNFAGSQPSLGFNSSVEVGPFAATGHGVIGMGASLNGTDLKSVSLSGGAGLVTPGGFSMIGPLTANEANLTVGSGFVGGGFGPETILEVKGGITQASTSFMFFIDHSGTTPGTDYSQLTTSGAVNLAGAHLSLGLGGEEPREETFPPPCGRLTPGDVDTLLTTTGSLTGTFAGIPNGTVIPFTPESPCEKAGEEWRTVKINYSANAVTATVQESAEDKKPHEEEVAAKKHQEEEVAAKKHQEEEAAAKKHQEEEAAAKKHQEEEAAAASIRSGQIQELLAGLTPSGRAAKIAALLKSGGFVVTFKALEPGNAVIDWYRVPPGAKLAKTKAKPILVAAGQMTFSAARTAKINVKLTAAGKRLLKHAKSVKLTAKGTFTPTGKAPITTTKVFVLKR
jgi:hypothetical protein